MTKLVKVVTHHVNPEKAAELFAKEGIVAVGWIRGESIAGKTRDEIRQMCIDEEIENPEWGASQLIMFRDELEVGDITVAYRTKNIVALVGEVIGEYEFNNENDVGEPEHEGGEIDYPNQKKVLWWDKPRNFHRNLLPGDLSETVASRGTIKILDYDVDVSELKEALDKISSIEASREKIIEVTGEDEIKEYLKKRIGDLEEGLTLKKAEYEVSVGSIDILAEDENSSPVVIEVKVKADDSAVGQILGYTQAYEEESESKKVRSVIVAQEFTERCKKAAKRAGIKLAECRKTFTFKKID
jgi:predicted Mrr-cat superfamily restriction endonuclease